MSKEEVEIKVMASGRFAGDKITDLESTYIVHMLEKTKMIPPLKKALLKELHRRFPA